MGKRSRPGRGRGNGQAQDGDSKVRSIIRINNWARQVVNLYCEWSSCREIITTGMEQFIKHVTLHLTSVSRIQDSVELSLFPCEWTACQFSTNDGKEFTRHVLFHAFHARLKSVGQFIQEEEGLESCALDPLGQSRNVIPDLPERFFCGWLQCEQIYDNPEYFYRHVDTHSENCHLGTKPQDGHEVCCEWEDCERSFKNKYKLREHLRSHTQEKICACAGCGGLFTNRTKLHDHLTRQRVSEKNKFQCSHCYKSYATHRLLRDHVRHHVNHNKCPFCEMTTPSSGSLRMHIKYRHTNDKPFKCTKCDYRAKTNHDLRKHFETHCEDSVYACHAPDCAYTTRCFSSLTLHFRKAHKSEDGKRYMCHYCNHRFTRGNKLTQHLMKKHNFTWPPGHSRFSYKLHEDGYFRLQTIRYESIELSEQISTNQDSSQSHSQELTIAECSTAQNDSELQLAVVMAEPADNMAVVLASGDDPIDMDVAQGAQVLYDITMARSANGELELKPATVLDTNSA